MRWYDVHRHGVTKAIETRMNYHAELVAAIAPPSLLLPVLLLPLVLATSTDAWFSTLALSFTAAFPFLLALASALFATSFTSGLLQ